MDVNAVTLSGELVEIEPLRYTPAGIPLLGFKLAHKSWQVEAGHKRLADCEMSGVAMGEAAVEMSRMRQGRKASVEGFLNRKNRMSAQVVLHVTKVQTLKDTDYAKTGIEQSQSES